MCKEENNMTPIVNKSKLWDIARKQTTTNTQGKTVISKSDDSFNDDVWDKIYKDSIEETTR